MRNSILKKRFVIIMLLSFIWNVFAEAIPVWASGIEKAGLSWNLGQTRNFITYNCGSSTSNSWKLYAKDDKYGYIITTGAMISMRYSNTSGAYCGSSLQAYINGLQTCWSAGTEWQSADAGSGYIVNHKMADVGIADGEKLYVLGPEIRSYGNNVNYDATSVGGSTNYTSIFSTSSDLDSNRVACANSSAKNWWLRSAGGGYDVSRVGTGGALGLTTWSNSQYVRAALQIDLRSPLFSSYLFSTSESGKSTVTVGGGFNLSDTTEALTHKTVHVDTITAPTTATATSTAVAETVDSLATAAGAGGTIDLTKQLMTGTKTKVTYSALTGTMDYVSALVADGDGNYVNYAKLAADGSAKTDLAVNTSQLANGTYKMYVFGEQINGTTYNGSSEVADAASSLTYAGDITVTDSSYKNYGTLSSSYAAKALTANLGGGFNLSFENADYDTAVTVASSGATITSNDSKIASLAVGGNTNISGNVAVTNVTRTDGTVTVTGTLTSDKMNATGTNNKLSALGTTVTGTNNIVSGADSTATGTGNNVSGTNSLAIGTGHTVSGNNAGAIGDPNVVVGSGSYAIGNDNYIGGDNTFVMGNNVNTSTYTNSVVLGNGSALNQSDVVSVGSETTKRKIINVADGVADSDVATVGQLKNSSGSVEYIAASKYDGTGANASVVASGTNDGGATAIGYNSSATESFATAIGYGANVSGVSSVAFGHNAKAGGDYSIASGHRANASGNSSTAYGWWANASGNRSTAVGSLSRAAGDYSSAFGNCAMAWWGSTAVGNNARASGAYSSAFGENALASGDISSAFGFLASATGDNTSAFGRAANASGNDSVAFGYNACATHNYSVAIGSDSCTSGTYEVSVGSSTQKRKIINVADGVADSDVATVGQLKNSSGSVEYIAASKYDGTGANASVVASGTDAGGATAIGYGSNATANYATAIGYGASATHESSVALGKGSCTSGTYEVSVGTAEQTRKISNVTAVTPTSGGTYAATTGQLYNATLTQGSVSGSDVTLKNAAGTTLATVDLASLTTTQGTGNATNISTLKSYFNASGVANCATADASGNVISTTYAKAADVYTKTESDSTFATQTSLTTHTGDTTVHITAAERTKWDGYETTIAGKADKATTLSGYGITDAYTKTAADSAISTAVGNEATARDTAISTAISTEVTDRNTAITNAINTEVTNRDSAIATAVGVKANISDVYAKTETYSSSEIDTKLSGKQATLTEAQLAAANSGITATKVTTYDAYDGRITANTNEISGLNTTVSGLGTRVTTAEGKITTAETNISTLQGYFDASGKAKEALHAAVAGNATNATNDGAGNNIASTYATNTALAGKADKATTLAGYGITDAYTKTAADSAISTAVGNEATARDAAIATAVGVKANISDVYAKTETYSSSEIDTKLSGKQATLTEAQLAAVNSGITATKVTTYDAYDGRITANTNEISGLNTTVSGLGTRVTTAEGKITTAETNISTLQGYFDASGNAKEALHATNANYATTAGNATNATNDGAGNNIASTYATNTALAGKADKSTTLSGYGITDAYTKTEVDSAVSTAVGNEATARDTAISTAISTEVTDRNTAITNAINTEVTNRDSAIATAVGVKANASDVYKKTETYSQTETNSAISTAVGNEATARDSAISTAVSTETTRAQAAESIKVNGGSNINAGNGVEFAAGDNVTLATDGNKITISSSEANAVHYDTDLSGNRLNKITLQDNTGHTTSPVAIANVASATSIEALSQTNRYAVNGADLFNETRLNANGTYISDANTAAANLKALDTQVKKNADNTITGFTQTGTAICASTAGSTTLKVADNYDWKVTGGTVTGTGTAKKIQLTQTDSAGNTDSSVEIDVSDLSGAVVSGALEAEGNLKKRIDSSSGSSVAVFDTKDDTIYNSVTVVDDRTAPTGAGKTYSQQTGNGITIGHYDTDGSTKITDSALTKNTLTVSGLNYITASGINANDKQITNIANAVNEKDAVNYAQLKGYTTVNVTNSSGTTALANTGSGIVLKAGENAALAVSGNEVTISSLGGEDTLALHYDKDGGGSRLNSATLKDALGGTEAAVTLKNVANGTADSDAATYGQVKVKADKATTLSGYGITDAYTKTAADSAISTAVGNEATARDAAIATAVGVKANISDVYAKTETYSSSEIDTKLSGKQATLTEAQLAAANSGITATKVTTYNAYDGRITANTNEISGLNTTVSGLGTRVTTAESNITTLQGYFDASGNAKEALHATNANYATAAGSATNDGAGNNIASTYATNSALADKADKATTLSGYGITDAYTKTAADSTFAKSADIASTYATKETVSAIDTRVVSAEGNISALQGEMTTVQSDVSTLSGKVTTAEGKIGTLETKVADAESNITTLRSDMSSAKTDITNIKSDVATVKDDVSTLQGDMTTVKSDVSGIKTDVSTLKTEMGTVKTDVSGLKTDMTAVQSDVTTLQSDMNTAKTDITNIKSDVTVVKDDVTTLSGKVTTVEGNITTLQGDMSNVKTAIADIKTQGVETKDASGNETKVEAGKITVKDSAGAGTTNITSTEVKTNTVTADTITADSVNSKEVVTEKVTVDGKSYITTDGINANSKTITNVADAVNATDAVNKQQLENATTITVNGTETVSIANGLNFAEGDGVTLDTTAAGTIKISANGATPEIISGKKAEGDEKAKVTETAATAMGYNAQVTAQGGTAIGYGNTVSGAQSTAVGYKNTVSGSNSGAFGDPNTVTGDGSYAVGNNNTINGNNNFVLGNNVTVDATVENSVALGNNSTVTESNVVSVGNTTDGGQRRITNVAAGIYTTDAATVGQLSTVAEAVVKQQSQIAETSREVKEVGAISAALAGLHYVEPSGEGDDKLTGAVAYGGYRGESAAAVGLAYKPNPNLMVSASTSVGQSQNAYNAEISYKFGKGETAATRATLQKQVKYLNDRNKQQDEVISAQNAKIAEQGKENAQLKAENQQQNEKIEQLINAVEELKNLIKK